jgi:hypothetical protein
MANVIPGIYVAFESITGEQYEEIRTLIGG